MEGDRGKHPILTFGLHMHGHIHVYTLTHMRTYKIHIYMHMHTPQTHIKCKLFNNKNKKLLCVYDLKEPGRKTGVCSEVMSTASRNFGRKEEV